MTKRSNATSIPNTKLGAFGLENCSAFDVNTCSLTLMSTERNSRSQPKPLQTAFLQEQLAMTECENGTKPTCSTGSSSQRPNDSSSSSNSNDSNGKSCHSTQSTHASERLSDTAGVVREVSKKIGGLLFY